MHRLRVSDRLLLSIIGSDCFVCYFFKVKLVSGRSGSLVHP